jgi:acetyl-CoA carboxylase carboxyl transferase subunit alpha
MTDEKKGKRPPRDLARRREARERLRRWQERARQRRAEESKAEAEKKAVEKPATGAKRAAKKPTTEKNPNEIHGERQAQIESLERDVVEMAQFAEKSEDLERLRREIDELKREFYAHLSAWPRVQLARHQQRPYTEDYIKLLFENFSEIHGDRRFADDAAIIAGMARFHGQPVLVVGSQKGRDTKQRVLRNFGQAKPEGYRKAIRAMELAAKFNRPIFVFVDTQGAYPGVDAEERGQAEAIAYNLREMSRLPVPIIVTITGEGGSGGALAIAIGDRVLMLENSVYSVITPEGCASIIWRDSTKAELAAEALKITATDLLELKLIDEIVPEPEGGAHTDHATTAALLDPVLVRLLKDLSSLSPQELLDLRYQKFRRMGQYFI